MRRSSSKGYSIFFSAIALSFIWGCGTSASTEKPTGLVSTKEPSISQSMPPSSAPGSESPADPGASKTNPLTEPDKVVIPKSKPGDDSQLPIKGQPKQVTPLPSSKGENGWSKCDLTPAEIAAKMDKAFSAFENVRNQAVASFVIPTGTGRIRLDSYWKSPKVFDVQYPALSSGHLTLETVRSDGHRVMTLLSHAPGKQIAGDQSAWVDPRPLPSVKPADGKALLSAWPEMMPKLAFSRFTAGKDVFGPLFKALADDPSIELFSETRTKSYNKMLITDYRIVARRKEAEIAAKGDLEVEVVVDSRHFVPVTMRTRFGDTSKRVTMIDWAGSWSGNYGNPKDFVLPKSSALAKS